MTQKKYSVYVYQIKKNNKVVATFCCEQDAIDHIQKFGGEMYTIGAY